MSNALNTLSTAVDAYVDFCAYDAASSFTGDEDMNRKADVAWDVWRGMRLILATMFGITERQVEDDVEQLMFDATFGN